MLGYDDLAAFMPFPRDEAQAKMSALRERSEREQTLYGFEIKELKRIIDHDQKLKDFMAVKSQERTEMKAIEAAKRKRKGSLANPNQSKVRGGDLISSISH